MIPLRAPIPKSNNLNEINQLLRQNNILKICYYIENVFLRHFNIDQVFIMEDGRCMRLIILALLIKSNFGKKYNEECLEILDILINRYGADINMAYETSERKYITLNVIYCIFRFRVYLNIDNWLKYFFDKGSKFPRMGLIIAVQLYNKKNLSKKTFMYMLNKCPSKFLNEYNASYETVYNISNPEMKKYLRIRYKNKIDIREPLEIDEDETLIRLRMREPVFKIIHDNAGFG